MKNKKTGNKENFKNVCHRFFRKEDIFLIPNVLSYLRMLLIVAFMCCYLIPFSIHDNPLGHIYLSVGMLMLGAYSDFIDGYIARTFDQVSELGKVLDPVADKLLQFAIAIVILINYYQIASVNIMFGVFLAKEITLFFEDLFLARNNTAFNGAKWYGKVSSFVFYVVTTFILLGVPIIESTKLENIDAITKYIVVICCNIATACLTLAWVLYFILFIRMINDATKPQSNPKEEEKKND